MTPPARGFVEIVSGKVRSFRLGRGGKLAETLTLEPGMASVLRSLVVLHSKQDKSVRQSRTLLGSGAMEEDDWAFGLVWRSEEDGVVAVWVVARSSLRAWRR